MRANLLAMALVLAIASLAGCASPTEFGSPAQSEANSSDPSSGNTPPVAILDASKTNGTAPIRIAVRHEVYDQDGDGLEVTFEVNDGVATYGIPATSGAPTNRAIVENWDIELAREFVLKLTVSDGQTEDTKTLYINITGPSHIFVINETLPVSQACAACSSGASLGLTPPGPFTCQSYMTSSPGMDCQWIFLPPEFEGKLLEVYGAHDKKENVGLYVTTDCDPTGRPIEGRNGGGRAAMFLPAGAGCAIAWFAEQDGGDLVFRVYR